MKKPCRKSGGKIKFETHEAAAIRAGEVLMETNKKVLGTYRCPFCNKWHLTSSIFSDNVRE
jgi:hypothetical protein